MKIIKLTQGKQTIVDDADFDFLNQWKWHYNVKYAVGQTGDKGAKKRVYLHTLLLKKKPNQFIDHINGNRLDNRRTNLRLCSNRQNQQNRARPSNNTSGFKGVVWNKKSKKWQSGIKINSKQVHLGLFNDKFEAHNAYYEAAKKYFGEFAHQ